MPPLRKPFALCLTGGPFDGQTRTVPDVQPPTGHSEWDPQADRMAMYRPVYVPAGVQQEGDRYVYEFTAWVAAPAGVRFRRAKVGPCPACGQRYERAAASHHFVRCDVQDCNNKMEHPGCCHR
jgi:hypothetical protein